VTSLYYRCSKNTLLEENIGEKNLGSPISQYLTAHLEMIMERI
jgi:hypothetical protein